MHLVSGEREIIYSLMILLDMMSEITLLGTQPCPKCGSKDVRYRRTLLPRHACRRCGKTWIEEGDDEQ